MKEPIPVYIVRPINYGGVWLFFLLGLGFLYHLFYTNFSDISATYWFLKPVLYLPGGVIESAWNMDDSHTLWQFSLTALAVLLSPFMLGFGFALSVLALPLWGIWWLAGDTVLAVWQPVTLGLLMLLLILGVVFSWKWWRSERRFGSARWPAALFALFVLLTLPNIAYWAGLVYWDQYDAEQIVTAKGLWSNGDSESVDALVELARESGTGEVYYLAAGALTASERYRDVAELLVHAASSTSPREMLFMYPVVKGLQRGYDTGYYEEVLALNDLPSVSAFLPSSRADRIETGFNRLEDEYQDVIPAPGLLCRLPLLGLDGDSPRDAMQPESLYVLAFLPTSEAGLLFCRMVKSALTKVHVSGS